MERPKRFAADLVRHAHEIARSNPKSKVIEVDTLLSSALQDDVREKVVNWVEKLAPDEGLKYRGWRDGIVTIEVIRFPAAKLSPQTHSSLNN